MFLFLVIPAKAGIQGFRHPSLALDPRLRGDDSRDYGRRVAPLQPSLALDPRFRGDDKARRGAPAAVIAVR